MCIGIVTDNRKKCQYSGGYGEKFLDSAGYWTRTNFKDGRININGKEVHQHDKNLYI